MTVKHILYMNSEEGLESFKANEYISPKDALGMFKDNGIEYITYRRAIDVYCGYNDMYMEYWKLRDNVKNLIKDICTGHIENKRNFSILHEYIFDDKVENREITVYEKKKVSCTNNSIEHMYVEVSPEEVEKADNYNSYYINCEELLLVIDKSFIMEEEEKINDN